MNKNIITIKLLMFLGIHECLYTVLRWQIVLKFIIPLLELKKKKIFFLAISSFYFTSTQTQSVKLQVGSCDCSTDFTQCNYCSDTRTERYKEKKRPYRLLALNTGRNQTESQCVISRPIKPHQEQQGGKCFTSSSHSLTFVENYSN